MVISCRIDAPPKSVAATVMVYSSIDSKSNSSYTNTSPVFAFIANGPRTGFNIS